MLTRWEGSPASVCWQQHFPSGSQGYSWPPSPQGLSVDSCSACCLPGPPDSSPPGCLAAVSHRPVLWMGLFLPRGKILHLPLWQLKIPFGQFFQPVKVHLNGSTNLWCVHHSSCFCIISKLAEFRDDKKLSCPGCS